MELNNSVIIWTSARGWGKRMCVDVGRASGRSQHSFFLGHYKGCDQMLTEQKLELAETFDS